MAGVPADASNDLDVRMTFLKKIEQGDTDGILLWVSSTNMKHSIKITYTGIHLDWQEEDEFFENTSEFQIVPRDTAHISLGISCPKGTPLGMHSDYIYIEYDLQDGPNGTWNSYIWISETTNDFEVIAAAKTSSGGGSSSFESMLNYLCPAMIVIAVIGAILMVVRDRRKAAEKRAQMNYFMQPVGPGNQYATYQPGTSYQYPSHGPAVGMTQTGYPEYGNWTCPQCASPASGSYCSMCGHLYDGRV